MKILERARQVALAVEKDNDANGTLGFRIKDLAIKAMLGGVTSQAWEDYMTLFADNKDQLKRLKGLDVDAPWAKEMGAYMVAGGPCGALTPHRITENLTPEIDNGIVDDAPDGTITRKIDIP